MKSGDRTSQSAGLEPGHGLPEPVAERAAARAGEPRDRPRNRFDLAELSGAFGDLGTLIPFVVAYVGILGMDASAVLLPFGIALIAVGFVFRTPFPVQPMKAIGATALTHAALTADLNAHSVVAAGLVTGLFWLVLALSGLLERVVRWIPRAALLGVVMGLGFAFMLEGARLMAVEGWLAAALLVLTLALLSRRRPAMLVLLVLGAAIALAREPALASQLAGQGVSLSLPAFAWPGLDATALWTGALLLALPQLPLTFGNALIAVTGENNRLYPDRLVSERKVALSTGLMNLLSSAIGGIPMCHGAGGLAAHTRFGARTGGAPILLGSVLVLLALFFGEAITLLFALVPSAVLGVLLFLAGVELALGSRDTEAEKSDRFVVLATAGLAVWHPGVAVLFGIGAHHAARTGWLRM
jgi:MFS superfamily sulfate permease-like transporter